MVQAAVQCSVPDSCQATSCPSVLGRLFGLLCLGEFGTELILLLLFSTSCAKKYHPKQHVRFVYYVYTFGQETNFPRQYSTPFSQESLSNTSRIFVPPWHSCIFKARPFFVRCFTSPSKALGHCGQIYAKWQNNKACFRPNDHFR